MRAIVTGGAGFIGSNLVDMLISKNFSDVLVVDNLSTGIRENINPLAIFEFFDIRNDWLSNDVIGSFSPDVIFHIAALARIQPSFKNPYNFISSNCGGTVRMLEFARNSGSRVVYAGSSSFYFDTYANPYAHSKWIGEEHCKMYNKIYGLSVAIARFFNVYGLRHIRDGDNANVLGIFERQKTKNEPLTITGTGEQRRDFASVNDICRGLIEMANKKWNGEVFNLGSSVNYSIIEVANMFKPEKIVNIPSRLGEAKDTLADITFSKYSLGWEPKENLPDYIECFLRSIIDK